MRAARMTARMRATGVGAPGVGATGVPATTATIARLCGSQHQSGDENREQSFHLGALVGACIFEPKGRIKVATPAWLFARATSAAVLPSPSLALPSAPALSKTFTVSCLPNAAARWSGVLPPLSSAL